MIYRVTNKLAKKIKEKPAEALPVEPNPFIDWSADHFVAGHLHHIVLMHNPTALSLYLHSRGVADASTFLGRANDNIRGGLKMYGFEMIYLSHIAPHLRKIRFSKVGNRKLSGILAQLVWHAKFQVAYKGLSPSELTLDLNEMPQCSLEESWPLKGFEKLAAAYNS